MSILDKYADIELQIRELEDKKADLRPSVLAHLKNLEDMVTIDQGSFIKTTLTKWEYSPTLVAREKVVVKKITNLKETLDQMKERARLLGHATIQEKSNFKFVPSP